MSIFVSIICFKDTDLINTVQNLLRMAGEPDDITIGVILQEDEEFLYQFSELKKIKNVILKIFPTSWASGCGKARAEAQKLYNGQDYFFQTDSHMRFDPGWDLKLINEMKQCPPKSILTTLPPGFNPATEEKDASFYSEIVFSYFFRHLPITVGMTYPLNAIPVKPKQTPFIAGGVLFAPGNICDMEFDPYFYFHGEEFSTNLRLWTRGYTNYSPRFNFCYHYYRNANDTRAPTIVELNPALDRFLYERSISRYHALINLKPNDTTDSHLIDLDRYGLGTSRSIHSWEETYGIWLLPEIVNHDTQRVIPPTSGRHVTTYPPHK